MAELETVEKTVNTILLVDDEENILSSLQRLLRREGYNIVASPSPEKALDVLRERPVTVIVSDQRMPEMDGTEFLAQARDLQPEAVRIMLTGYADISAAMAAINQGHVYRFITKPWNDLDLKATIKQAIDTHNLKDENRRLYALAARQNAELQELNENLEKKVDERTREIAEKNRELDGLYKELQTSYYQTIRVFLDLIELHDPALGGHAKRVAVLSRLIAEKCDLRDEAQDLTEAAASLHDIGLIGTPREVIRKGSSGRTAAEEALYRQHPALGYAILNSVPKLHQISALVKYHHEWFNGNGYPEGLARDRIPLGARIIAAADVFDRLSARKNITRAQALSQLFDLAGERLDPTIVSAAIEAFSEIRKTERSETAVTLEDLKPDMALARDLRTVSGRLLMPKGAVLKEAYLDKVKKFHAIDPIVGWIYVYK